MIVGSDSSQTEGKIYLGKWGIFTESPDVTSEQKLRELGYLLSKESVSFQENYRMEENIMAVLEMD